MDSLSVFRQAGELVRKYGTRDPLILAENLGIRVYREPLGDLLGMYTYRLHHKLMFLNDRLEEELLHMVAAHELGHACRHTDLAGKTPFQEFNLFRMKTATEYEANAFAAHLLLENDRVLALAKEGYDVVNLSATMHTDINLMLIKMQEMNKLGFAFTLPYRPDSTFFGKIKGSQLKEEYDEC